MTDTKNMTMSCLRLHGCTVLVVAHVVHAFFVKATWSGVWSMDCFGWQVESQTWTVLAQSVVLMQQVEKSQNE